MTDTRGGDYADSGVDWLGALPAHWTVKPIKAVATLNDEVLSEATPPDSEIEYVEISDVAAGRGILGSTALSFEAAPSRARRRVTDGDIIVSTVRTYLRAIASVESPPDNMVVSTGFAVIRPRRIDPTFLAYALEMDGFINQVIARSVGVSYPAINASELVRLPVPVPPTHEQAAISAFLDRETGKIDALVETQRRLIDLLKEKRQAAIAHAVTKGLDPVTRMKGSGVEWLGEVPAHWAVMPIRKVARLESGHTPSRQKAEYWVQEECVIPWFTLADVGVLRNGKVTHVSDTTHRISELGMANSAARLLPPDTVFLSRTASVGFSGIMTQPMAVSQDFAAWVCGPELSSEYLLLCLRAMRPEFRRLMMGSTHQTIYMPDIEKLSIPLPPRAEQEAIVHFAFSQKTLLDNLEDEAEKAIRLLRERRAGLISAAVVGKIDVRQTTTTATADQATARRLVGAAVLELVADNANSGRMTSAKRMYLAEAHAGVWELRGQPERKAAGPFDSALMSEVETELARVGHIAANQPGGPASQVLYSLTGTRGALRVDLDAMLGDRRAVFDKMLTDVGTLESKGVEAVATLYAVWNDMLIDGQTPTDDEVINGVLNDWHAEKRDKFTRPDLVNYLGWMRRHDFIPSGRGPRTKSGALL